jgi:transposase
MNNNHNGNSNINSSGTNSASHPQPELVAYIGVDWADKKHDVTLWVPGTDTLERFTVAHTPEALVEWIAALRVRFGGKPVGICLEQSRGPLAHALWHHDHLVLYPVNPKTVARFREALRPSGAKDDPLDSQLALEILRSFRAHLRPWVAADPLTRQLALLVEDRRRLIAERTRATNRLRATLKGYFPQALELVGEDLAARLATDFLAKWPTLEAIQNVKPATLRAFYYGHNSRSEELIAQRLEQVGKATALTTDSAVIAASTRRVQALGALLATLREQIAVYDEQIEQVFAQHPERALCESLPAAGPALGPRLAAALGSDRERWPTPESLQCFSGIAPVTEQSGSHQWQHLRWACPKFLRQTFHEWADASRQEGGWAGCYYEHQLACGKEPAAAARALAFKWQRIVWRCWQKHETYDEGKYLRSLQQKGVKLYAHLFPKSGPRPV